MHIDKRSSRWSAFRVYAVCLMGCGALLALAGAAFSISTDMVGPAAAQVEQRWSGAGSPVLAALPAVDDSVQGLFPSRRPAASLPRSVVPVMISRVPDNAAATSAAVGEEAASPDVDEWATYEPWTPDRDDTYRTVCVRLCDGAYFPISFATTRDRFKADAAKCKSTCGSPAKLFVGRPDGLADDLADVHGQLYADLPNAFKYRTSYDAACTCKAQPWETSEIQRHRQLAEAARQKAQAAAQMSGVAAVLPRSERHVETAAIQSVQTPRDAKVEMGSLRAAKPPVPVAAAELNIRQPAVRSPAGRAGVAAVKVAGSGKTSKFSVTVKKRIVDDVRLGAIPQRAGRPAIGHLDASSMQRPFRSKEYWRLSYWEAPGF